MAGPSSFLILNNFEINLHVNGKFEKVMNPPSFSHFIRLLNWSKSNWISSQEHKYVIVLTEK